MRSFLAYLFFMAWAGTMTSGQTFDQHFPHGQKILFLKADGNDTAIHQMIHDSSYLSVQDPNGNGKVLFHTGQWHFAVCQNIHPFILESINAYANSDLAYYRFRDSASLFRIELQGTILVEIETGSSPGSSHTFGNKTLVLTEKSWYNADGIQDSVLYFYPEKNGSPDFNKTPVIFGASRGWICGGEDAPFRQIGQIDAFGNYSGGLNIPGWQDYFPEEAGDVKRWEIRKAIPPDPNYPIGRVDSFISVTRYTDSIVVKKRVYILHPDWTWQNMQEYEQHIFPPKDLFAILKQENFSRFWLPVPELWDAVLNSNIYLDRSKDKLDIEILFDGTYSEEDSCSLNQITDTYVRQYYSKQYGKMTEDHVQWGYDTEILIAAKVGNHQFGNLALSYPEQAAPVLDLYPNPTHSTLLIGGDYPGARYEIIDLAGAMLLAGTLSENSIAVDGLADGTYFLRVLPGDGSVVSGKFVKAAY